MSYEKEGKKEVIDIFTQKSLGLKPRSVERLLSLKIRRLGEKRKAQHFSGRIALNRRIFFTRYFFFTILAVLLSNLNPLQNIQFEDSASPGGFMQVRMSIVNDLGHDLKDLRIRAVGLEIDTEAVATRFDVEAKESTAKTFLLPIPEGTLPGEYLIKFTLENEKIKRAKYRPLIVK